MTSTMRAERGQVEGNTLALPLLGIAPAQQGGQETGNGVAWLLPIVAASIDDCMSRKEAAIRLGLSEGTLSRQLTGADGKCLNFEKFGQLGDAVVIALIHRLRAHYGLDDQPARISRAMQLISTGLADLVAEVNR